MRKMAIAAALGLGLSLCPTARADEAAGFVTWASPAVITREACGLDAHVTVAGKVRPIRPEVDGFPCPADPDAIRVLITSRSRRRTRVVVSLSESAPDLREVPEAIALELRRRLACVEPRDPPPVGLLPTEYVPASTGSRSAGIFTVAVGGVAMGAGVVIGVGLLAEQMLLHGWGSTSGDRSVALAAMGTLLGAGAAVGGLGAVMIALGAHRVPPRAAVTPWITPMGAGIGGSF